MCLDILRPLQETVYPNESAGDDDRAMQAEMQHLHIMSCLAIALCLKELGDFDKALGQLDAVRSGIQSLDGHSDVLATILFTEYSIYSQAGRLQEAKVRKAYPTHSIVMFASVCFCLLRLPECPRRQLQGCVQQLTKVPNALTPTLQCIQDLASTASTFHEALTLFEFAEQNLPDRDDVRPCCYSVSECDCTHLLNQIIAFADACLQRITMTVNHIQTLFSHCLQLPECEAAPMHNAAVKLVQQVPHV